MIQLFIRQFINNNIPIVLIYRDLFLKSKYVEIDQKNESNLKYNLFSNTSIKKSKFHKFPEILYLIDNFLFTFMAFINLIKIVKKYHNYNLIIHSFDTVYDGLAAILIKKLLNIPVVIHTHGVRTYYQHYFSNSIIVKLISFEVEKYTIKNCNMLISVNIQGRDFWINNGISPENIKVLPVAIETKKYQINYQLREQLKNDFNFKQELVFGYVGRLSKEKNIMFMLEAFRLANINAKLVIIGDGPYFSEIQNYIEIYKLSNIYLLGYRNDVDKILNLLDVIILPSLIEGLSTVIIEALCNQKIVLASNIESNKEIIDNRVNGLLFDPNNINNLITLLWLVFSDELLRVNLKNNIEKDIHKYEIADIYNNLMTYYQKVLSPI